MLREDIRRILKEFSPEIATRHTKTIGETFPMRLSGTEALERAAMYILDELKSYGFDNLALHELEGLISLPTRSELHVLKPVNEIIGTSAFAHIGSTSDAGIEADLVYIGPGAVADYDGKNVKGRIVLAELSMAPPRPEKVRIATMKGTAAVILSNWGPSDSQIIPLGTAKSVWGNPTPENIAMMDVVPAIGISRKDGEYLAGLCKKGPVTVRLVAQATREWKKLYQPWARLEGVRDADKFVVVGGHLDAWVQGITDNATGNALMLELARVLAKHRSRLSRSIEFAFWVGHENGILEGSTWYVDNEWDRLNRDCLLYVNVDQPGMKGTSRYVVWSSPETVAWHTQIDRETVSQVKTEQHRLMKISDQSFFGVGVPSVYGLTLYSEEEIEKWHGAIVGPYFHSEHDTMEFFDVALLMQALQPMAAYIFDICTRLVLPFEYEAVADEFISQLMEYQGYGCGHLDISDLIDLSKKLKEKAGIFTHFARDLKAGYDVAGETEKKDFENRAELINRCLMRLARILTPVRAQVVERYGQDSYGLSSLHKSIPMLYEMEQLAKIEPQNQKYKLLMTKMVRQRNRVADALLDAIWHMDNTMDLLSLKRRSG